MRVVIGGESLMGQKTGIGHYTEQLSRRLLTAHDIDDFQFLAHGKLFDSKDLLIENSEQVAPTSLIPDSLAKLRGILSQNRFAVWCYWIIMRQLDRRSLRHYGAGDIYHSPNYMLPEFPGKRVVTILDLSTVLHPEFHPRARVDLLNKYIDEAIKNADHIITISDFVKQEVIEHFAVSEDRITTTHLAADKAFKPLTENEFKTRNMFPDISYKGYFLFASTIEPRKNIDKLLDAYIIYRKRSPDEALPLIIVGHPGWHSRELHRRIKSLKKSGGLNYLGYVPQTQLPVLFAGARALLFPSIYEGFGLPVLEAMQAGTAVLTTRDSAMSEVSGDSALLVSANDVDEISNGICELSSNEEKLEQMRELGLARSEEFDWQYCADQTHKIYRHLVQ